MTNELFTNPRMDQTLGKLKKVQLKLCRYDFLQKKLLTTDISTHGKYQTTFKGFYSVGHQQPAWYEAFFLILEREKCNHKISFREVLEEMWHKTKRIEASFSSKLVATINPSKPVWDKYVLQHLGLRAQSEKIGRITTRKKDIESYRLRISETEHLHSCIQEKAEASLQCDGFREWKRRFNKKFPQFVHFTDIKKLDLFYWQLR